MVIVGFAAFDREGKKAIGRSATPLRIARREVHADVAFAERAKDRIGYGMGKRIAVRMTFGAFFEIDAQAAEYQRSSVDEPMRVISDADPEHKCRTWYFVLCTLQINSRQFVEPTSKYKVQKTKFRKNHREAF